MFHLVVFSFILCLNNLFCFAEEYYQDVTDDQPMGHFMEYSVEMPSSRSATSSSEPTMFMRYGNINKSGRYLRDFEIGRPNYRSHFPSPPPLVTDEYPSSSMPPFPFSLPYQYIDNKRYHSKPEPQQQPFQHQPWGNNEREFSPLLENSPNRNSWSRIYPSRDAFHRGQEQPDRYFDHQPHHGGYIPTRYSSTVDEIQNRIFSMMQNIATFPPSTPPSSPQQHNLGGGGLHRSGYSRESQFGYQMVI